MQHRNAQLTAVRRTGTTIPVRRNRQPVYRCRDCALVGTRAELALVECRQQELRPQPPAPATVGVPGDDENDPMPQDRAAAWTVPDVLGEA